MMRRHAQAMSEGRGVGGRPGGRAAAHVSSRAPTEAAALVRLAEVLTTLLKCLASGDPLEPEEVAHWCDVPRLGLLPAGP